MRVWVGRPGASAATAAEVGVEVRAWAEARAQAAAGANARAELSEVLAGGANAQPELSEVFQQAAARGQRRAAAATPRSAMGGGGAPVARAAAAVTVGARGRPWRPGGLGGAGSSGRTRPGQVLAAMTFESRTTANDNDDMTTSTSVRPWAARPSVLVSSARPRRALIWSSGASAAGAAQAGTMPAL